MAGEDLLTYSGQAAIAYQDALNQAKNMQNALLRQYGFVAPDASGNYSVEGAQSAFDPNTLFDKATGGIDQAKLSQLVGGLGVGGTGRIADISRAGASSEAEAAMEVRQRLGEGIGGGLMAQRRGLAEAMTAGQVGAAKSEFLAGLGEAMSPIGGAFQNLKIGEAYDEAARQEADIIRAGLFTPPTETPASPTGKPSLSAGPEGEFMKKMGNISKSSDKKAQIANLKTIKDKYALSGQQLQYLDNLLKRLGG